MIHHSIQGEMLDEICFAHYGTNDMLERVLEANPGIAALGAVLPIGTKVILPEKPAPKSRSIIRLWG